MNQLCSWFKIKHPLIMAPMFLVTNTKMVIAAYEAGIIGCIPALNFRTIDGFSAALAEMKTKTNNTYGINLIVNKSNIHYLEQLKEIEKNPPAFIITSLGSPKEVIKRCKPLGIKVFCDVINIEHAKKVEGLGADAIIAVNSGAGGHLGTMPASILIPMLKKNCSIPIISAGGVGNYKGFKSMLDLGAVGVSIGSPFIATSESEIADDYKNAIVNYGAEDIITTKKISGTPCTVINTPFVEKLGKDESFLEKLLNKNKTLKKYMKMLVYKRGMSWLQKAAFSASYKSIWCAGPSIEFVDKILSIDQLVQKLTKDEENVK